MRAWLALLLALLPSVALADAFSNIAPAQQGAGGRNYIRTNPAYYTPDDFGAAGDAVKAYSATYDLPASLNPTLRLLATYQFDGVTLNCSGTGNNNSTITLPAGSLPLMLGGATTMRIQIASCPGLTNAQLNSISGSGLGPYTITTDLSSTGAFSGTGTVVIEPTGLRGASDTTNAAQTPQWYHYGTGSISGTTLTMPTNTFNTIRDLTQQNASGLMSTYVAIDDPAGVCPQYRGTILSAASTTAATLSPAPSCIPAGSTLGVWSSDIMFPVNVATGPAKVGTPWSCRFWKSGTDAFTPVVLPVASYTDPFHVSLTGTPGTAAAALTTELECGTPDDTAIDNTAIAAYNAGYGSIYAAPGKNYFMSSDAAVTDIAKVSLCSDGYFTGRLLWTHILNFTRCTPTRGQPQMRATINPKVHLAHSLTVTGRNIKMAMIGDSLLQASSNGMGDAGSGVTQLNDWLVTSLGKPVTSFEYSIGGTTLSNLAPNAPNVSGNGAGLPTALQISTVATWYSNGSQKWIDYIKAACPDVVFVEFTNDSYNLLWSSFVDVNGYMQSAGWQSACGYTPDIIYVPTAGNSSGAYTTAQIEGFVYQQDFLRSAVLAGDTMPPGVTMGTGGAVGILDFGHSYNAKRFGYDQWAPQMTRAVDIAPGGAPNSTTVKWPFSWPRPVRNWQLATASFQTTTANQTTSTFWNTTFGGAFNVPLGNGAAGTPWNVNGQTTPATIGYPGNQIQMQRDAGGNIAVTGFTFRFLQTPASCSMTSGTATLTCTTTIANAGHYYASIIIQGAGAAACPADIGGSNCLFTSIAAAGVNATGKIITTVANASATITNAATNVVIYRTFLPYTITAFPAQINNGSDGSPVCAQCGYNPGLGFRVVGPIAEINTQFFTYGTPIFRGPVTRFGGKFTPIFNAGISGTTVPANQFNFVGLGQNAEDADDSTEWTPTLAVDADCWGQSPGLVGPKGGGYSGHMTTECMRHVLGDVLAANSLTAYDPYSQGLKIVAAAAGSTTIPNGATWLNLVPAGTIASFTANLPAVPTPNLPVTISTTQTITALTVGGSGFTINGAPSTLLANTAATFRFDAVSQTWNRVQ